MEQYNTIQWEIVEKGLGVLTLNRPKAYNSVNGEMLDELQAFWHTRLYDLETLVIILKGNGEKGFCAGLDMKYTVENMELFRQANEFYKFQARLGRLNLAMRRAPQPIIGLVHGAAAGVPAKRAFARHLRVDADRLSDLAALLLLSSCEPLDAEPEVEDETLSS